MSELLILAGASPDLLRHEIETRVKISQELPPRLVVVEGDADGIRAATGVSGVILASRATELELSLTPAEKIFVAAWRAGRDLQAKVRLHEGVNWGAKGFSGP